MVGLTDLWLPILLAAVAVFLASSVLHMVIPIHRKDYAKLGGEEELLAAMRKEGVQPGNYMFPHCTMNDMKSEEQAERYRKGPVGFLNVLPSGPPAMGRGLALWFLHSVVISLLVAYVTGRTLGAGADYLQVFRVAGTVAFLAYAGGAPVDSIWKGQRWSTSFKFVFDGLVYGLVTGGVFGWLWIS